MSFEALKKDAEQHRKRLLLADIDQTVKTELALNVWPWLEKAADAIHAEFEEQGAAIASLIEDEGTAIEPELAGRIIGLLTIGAELTVALESILPNLDDVSRKRLEELITVFRADAGPVIQAVQESTIDIDDDDEAEAEE